MPSYLALLIFVIGIGRIKSDSDCLIRLKPSTQVHGGTVIAYPCSEALFRASRQIRIEDRITEVVVIPSGPDLLCDTPNDRLEAQAHAQKAWRRVVVVRRGHCSFQRKAEVATALGYQGVVIINVDNSTFPFGEVFPDLSASLAPTVMAPASLLADLEAQRCSPLIPEHALPMLCRVTDMQIHFDSHVIHADTWASRSLADGASSRLTRVICASVIALCVIIALFFETPFGDEGFLFRLARTLVFIAMIVAITVISVSLKLGTFRTISAELASMGIEYTDAVGRRSVYDHRETDERVFETLINSVLNDAWNYRLSAQDVKRLGLAAENYSDGLFIHPPVFVYLCAALVRLFDLSLPALPLLMHAATLLLIPVLVHVTLFRAYLLGDASTAPASATSMELVWGRARSASLWAMTVFATCPIASFCSQKIWIDNAAALTATFGATMHLSVLACAQRMMRKDDPPGAAPSRRTHIAYALHFASGLIFGGVALNTKLPNFAMLPFMVISSLQTAHALISRPGVTSNSSDIAAQRKFIARYFAAFAAGAALGHGPWIVLYRLKVGRWLPNAWPSASMVAASPFLQRAIAKGAGAYVDILLRFAPVYLIGLSFPVLGIGGGLLRDASFTVSSVIQHSRYLMIDMWALPAGYLLGLSVLAAMGAGAQSRFMLPALPALAVLVGLAAADSHRPSLPEGSRPGRMAAVRPPTVLTPIIAILVAYGALHTLWYGVCFPSLFADLDVSVADVISTALRAPMLAPPSLAAAEAAWAQLRHFGLNVTLT